jgi:hypothetical protein
MPKDIESDVLVKDLAKGEGRPKANNPLSLRTNENALEVVKPPSMRNTEDSPEVAKSSSPKDAKERPEMTKSSRPTKKSPGPIKEIIRRMTLLLQVFRQRARGLLPMPLLERARCDLEWKKYLGPHRKPPIRWPRTRILSKPGAT